MGEIRFRPRDFPLAQNLRSVEIRGPIVGLKKDEQIQRLNIFWANFRSALGHAGLKMGESRPTLTSLRCKWPDPKPDPYLAKDYADMSEKEFSQMLAGVSDLPSLEGIANRRKILNAPQLKRYTQWQRDLILQRKWEILHG